jgi:hypothetical protein
MHNLDKFDKDALNEIRSLVYHIVFEDCNSENIMVCALNIYFASEGILSKDCHETEETDFKSWYEEFAFKIKGERK